MTPCNAQAWESGLVNLAIPTEFGGAGLHALDEVIVAEELAVSKVRCPGHPSEQAECF
jgi:alkylation response protein AidB-like acyl-CoA dehydrogenase